MLIWFISLVSCYKELKTSPHHRMRMALHANKIEISEKNQTDV